MTTVGKQTARMTSWQGTARAQKRSQVHALTIDSGWRWVAYTGLAVDKRPCKPERSVPRDATSRALGVQLRAQGTVQRMSSIRLSISW
jgi:hypothetical protein